MAEKEATVTSTVFKGKMPKVLYVSISDFGSIAEANQWCPREHTLLKYWCQNNKSLARRYFEEHGYVVVDDEVEEAEEIDKVEREFTKIIGEKRPKTKEEVDVIMQDYAKKICKAAEKDRVPEENVIKLKKSMESKLNKTCGTVNEKKILDKTQEKTGVVIKSRNDKMYYKDIYKDDEYIFRIGGKVDGISDDIIIEAKNRMSIKTVRKNIYDLFQLMGYIYVTGVSKGKIVQKCGNAVWDSDENTNKEWGIVTLDERWDNFFKHDLLTFFEELKNVPDMNFLPKPFLTKKKDKYLLASGREPIEEKIYEILYQSFFEIFDDEDWLMVPPCTTKNLNSI